MAVTKGNQVFLDRYTQTVMTPDTCGVCGDYRNDIVEERDRRTHRVLRRGCEDCMRRTT